MKLTPNSQTSIRDSAQRCLTLIATLVALVLSTGTVAAKGAGPVRQVGIEGLSNRIAISLDSATSQVPVGSELAPSLWSKAAKIHAKATATKLKWKYRAFRRFVRRYDAAMGAYLALAERARGFEDISRALYRLVVVIQEFSAPFCPQESDDAAWNEPNCTCSLMQERALVVAYAVMRASKRHGRSNMWTNKLLAMMPDLMPWKYPLYKAAVLQPSGPVPHRFVTTVSRAGRSIDFARKN